MPRPTRGLYEILVSEDLESELRSLDEGLVPQRTALRAAESADRIALHLSSIVERAVKSIDEDERVAMGIALARRLVEVVCQTLSSEELARRSPIESEHVLHAVLARLPDGRPEEISTPLIPLLDTTLLTNAPGEPRVGNQVLAEIHSSDRIDVVMAFIRHSGIRPLLGALEAHCASGRELRILTTTYTGSTESRALDALQSIGASVRVSYDTSSTRLHAKAWLFHRRSGFSTAYIGSSNLTHSAQVTGLEWNVRVSGARNPGVIEKVQAVFESYWNHADFAPYDRELFLKSEASHPQGATLLLPPTEIRLEPFQERLLEQIELSRQLGHRHNLLVSATGTGKTVMAAVYYTRLRERFPGARLLFVAHRMEILGKSLFTFRHAIRDPAFGELWVERKRPTRFTHVFASIQSLTLNASGLAHLDPEHFDIVILDEFHHAAAPSYQRLLDHLRPKELLGLTATPERADGLPILSWFENRIAAELRLWDAIDQHRLVPFVYYGVHDGLDLKTIPWRRGRGYDVDGLSNLLTSNDVWAHFVIQTVSNHVDSTRSMRALGFCVSIEHARFMARCFVDAGIAAVAVWSDTPEDERRAALADLEQRRVNAVFAVDLFNEGVDVPSLDTLLLLRPTDSPTLFLQQLGRGLRRHPNKSTCLVLDFVGHHRSEFRYDRRLRALFGGSRSDLLRQVEGGFPFLPAGCHMQLDPIAREIVLRSIRSSVPTRWSEKVAELRALAGDARTYPLSSYLAESGMEIDDVYAGNKSWSLLCADAGLSIRNAGPHEEVLRRACGRLVHIDDAVRIDAYRRFLQSESAPDAEQLSREDQCLLKMLVASMMDVAVSRSTSLQEACDLLWAHPQIRSELCDLLDVLESRIQHVSSPLSTHPDVPLRIHARYTRIEILSAFGVYPGVKVPRWQSGVYWAEKAKADLLAFTLDKTTGEFSPTTRYQDYAISQSLIHWQSQSVTRADSDTGIRYQKHVEQGSSILLFARLRSDERAFYFLGPAGYKSRDDSEQPMSIIWKLEHPLPGDLFATFAAAIA